MTPKERLLAALQKNKKETGKTENENSETTAENKVQETGLVVHENTESSQERKEENLSVSEVGLVESEQNKFEESKEDKKELRAELSTNLESIPDSESKVVQFAEDKPVDSRFDEIKMMMAELEQQLEDQVPGFHMILNKIHRYLADDPECVTILSEDEIGIIVSGLERHSALTITASKTNTGRSKTTKTQPITPDML